MLGVEQGWGITYYYVYSVLDESELEELSGKNLSDMKGSVLSQSSQILGWIDPNSENYFEFNTANYIFP